MTWSESHPNFPGHDKLHEHIRSAPVIRRHDPDRERIGRRRLAQCGPRDRRRVRISHAITRQSRTRLRRRRCQERRSDGVDQHAEAALRARRHRANSRPAAGKGARDLDVRHRLLRPQRSGRCDRRCRGSIAASGRPVRVQYMRHEGLAWDPKGTASVNRSRAGLDASGKVIAYENISKAFSRLNTATNEGRASHVLAGHLLGVPLEPELIVRSAGCILHVRSQAAGLGGHRAADGARIAVADDAFARSLWSADPVRQRILHR